MRATRIEDQDQVKLADEVSPRDLPTSPTRR